MTGRSVQLGFQPARDADDSLAEVFRRLLHHERRATDAAHTEHAPAPAPGRPTRPGIEQEIAG